jgi:alpha-glucosidase
VIYQDCPLNYLPVYVQAGKLFAQQSQIQHTGEQHDGILSIHLYKGKTGSTYVHYEDAGEGLNYLEGDYFSQEVQYQPEVSALKIKQSAGQLTSQYHSIRLYFHGFEALNPEIHGVAQEIQADDFGFLGKLTEFDPLPDQTHPYLEIKQLPYIQFQHTSDELEINGLN